LLFRLGMLDRRGETSAISLHRKARGPNVGPVERGTSALAGAALLAAATGLRSRAAAAAALVGAAALLARGATGVCPVYRRLGLGDAQRGTPELGLALAHAITMDGSRQAIESRAREAARWLPGQVSIRPLGGRRFEVSLDVSGRRFVSALQTSREDDGTFAWRSEPGAPFEHQGRVFFADAPGGRGTEVRAVVGLRPPAGRAGALAFRAVRGVAERALGHALLRLKQLVEAGEIPTAGPERGTGEAPAGARPARRLAPAEAWA